MGAAAEVVAGDGGRVGGGRGVAGGSVVRAGGGRCVRVSVRRGAHGWWAHRSGAAAAGTQVVVVWI
jgi:hypothetical protein